MHGEAIVLSAVGVSDAKSTKVQISLCVFFFFFFLYLHGKYEGVVN